MTEITSITSRVFNFNRNAFNSIYDSTLMLQNQTEQLAGSFIKASPMITAEGKQTIEEWMSAIKNGGKDFKKLMDDSFDRLEKIIVKEF